MEEIPPTFLCCHAVLHWWSILPALPCVAVFAGCCGEPRVAVHLPTGSMVCRSVTILLVGGVPKIQTLCCVTHSLTGSLNWAIVLPIVPDENLELILLLWICIFFCYHCWQLRVHLVGRKISCMQPWFLKSFFSDLFGYFEKHHSWKTRYLDRCQIPFLMSGGAAWKPISVSPLDLHVLFSSCRDAPITHQMLDPVFFLLAKAIPRDLWGAQTYVSQRTGKWVRQNLCLWETLPFLGFPLTSGYLEVRRELHRKEKRIPGKIVYPTTGWKVQSPRLTKFNQFLAIISSYLVLTQFNYGSKVNLFNGREEFWCNGWMEIKEKISSGALFIYDLIFFFINNVSWCIFSLQIWV